MNRTRPGLVERVLAQRPKDLAMSVITAAELRYGAENSGRREKALAALELLFTSLQVVPFDLAAVSAYGRIRADLTKAGKPIGPLDTLIAAHALALGVVLVTNNLREFRRVEGLSLEDWSAPTPP